MESDASNYALTAILSIVNEENKFYLVAFHFHTFITVELNYNIYDKELLAIFEVLFHYQGINPEASTVVQVLLLV